MTKDFLEMELLVDNFVMEFTERLEMTCDEDGFIYKDGTRCESSDILDIPLASKVETTKGMVDKVLFFPYDFTLEFGFEDCDAENWSQFTLEDMEKVFVEFKKG